MKKYLLFIISITLFSATIYYFYKDTEIQNGIKIDKIVVYKSQRALLAYSNGVLIKKFKISIGKNPIGKKEIKDDFKTPEGKYFISMKGPHPLYHKYLYVSYPNKSDILHAKALNKNPGGEILIHGIHKKYVYAGKFHRLVDWTKGCMALTNNEIEDLYNAVNVNTPIEIYP
jgi:murein L,D-transpeptidase YafK